MKEFNNLVLIKNCSYKNKSRNKRINYFATFNKAKKILIISFIALIIVLALIFLYFLAIKKINNKKKIVFNNIDNNNNSTKNNKRIMDANYEGNYNNIYNNFYNIEKNNEDNNNEFFEKVIIVKEKIEELTYTIIPTSYTFDKNTKYKTRGYYIEKEDNYQVYIIAGGMDILLQINEVIIDKGIVIVHITDEYDFSKRLLPRYGFTKIKFNKNPEKITIMNSSGKLFNYLKE